MYSALLLFFAPVAVQAGAVAIGLWIALAFVLTAKFRFEEQRLAEKFSDYAQYRRSVGALLPRFQQLIRL
jgi:protein-S-isoprenylcysteine O-methyltransferase Ste14